MQKISCQNIQIARAALFYDYRDSRLFLAAHDGMASALGAAADKSVLKRALAFFGYLVGILLITLVAGRIVGLLKFIAVYLLRWGGYGWKVTSVYTIASGVFLYGFYDQVMHIFWHPSLLDNVYSEIFSFIALPADLFQ